MIQEIILILIFAAALFYLGRLAYRSFSMHSGCAKGCGSCNAVDFKKIQDQIRQKESKKEHA
jgi:hypothetical protein